MREEITYKWNWNDGIDFANWMTKQVAYKVLSEFWDWYHDVEKTVSGITDNEQTMLDKVGEHSVACGCLRRSHRNRKNSSSRRCSPLNQFLTSRLGSSSFKAVFHSLCLPKILNFSFVYSCCGAERMLHLLYPKRTDFWAK